MNILDFFSTVAGGGVMGSVLHLGTSAFDVWRKGKEAKLEIELMTARVAAAEKTEAWKAFGESQAAGRTLTTIPEGTPPAIASAASSLRIVGGVGRGVSQMHDAEATDVDAQLHRG